MDLVRYAKKLGIDSFRGVYNKDLLPAAVRARECGIVNLEDSRGGLGTHWTAYHKRGPCAYYFDSFGLQPPEEVRRYLGSGRLIVNQTGIQKPTEVLCGHYCLFTLFRLNKGDNFHDIVTGLR